MDPGLFGSDFSLGFEPDVLNTTFSSQLPGGF
jgi:hypothetical protein